jgi:hypothetical protein
MIEIILSGRSIKGRALEKLLFNAEMDSGADLSVVNRAAAEAMYEAGYVLSKSPVRRITGLNGQADTHVDYMLTANVTVRSTTGVPVTLRKERFFVVDNMIQPVLLSRSIIMKTGGINPRPEKSVFEHDEQQDSVDMMLGADEHDKQVNGPADQTVYVPVVRDRLLAWTNGHIAVEYPKMGNAPCLLPAMTIVLKPNAVRSRLKRAYNLSARDELALSFFLAKNLAAGHIRQIDSAVPFAAPGYFVAKKGSKDRRYVINFTDLNHHCACGVAARQ